MNSRRSWVIYAVGTFAYLIAVTQRTTLGVAGVMATERFDISASVLSSLAVVQLIVYAGLQIPIGVILDRVGARWLLIAGAALMMIGQLTLAFAPSIGIAILGRVLVGAGDATAFVSVIRLINTWFAGRQVPLLAQWFGNIGQLGQVMSALPFALVLHDFGWSPAFVSAAAASAVALVLIVVVISDASVGGGVESERVESWSDAFKELRRSLRRPGTQLGFWSHYVTQSSGVVFTLLWGYPFMVSALGYDPGLASSLIIVIVLSGMVAGPVLGVLTARYPFRRSNLVIAIVVAMGIAWAAVLAWPGQPPLWLVVLLLMTLGVGGPGSQIGFDFARTFNPRRGLGSATGFVNVGGFLASFVMMFLIGVVLDAANAARVAGGAPSDLYALDSFRLAFLVQYVVVGLGVIMLFVSRRRTRRRLAEDEGIQVGPLWVALVEARARRKG
ncbi:nitrate/nitrite transporter [Microbacteriaceae bacterium 4G12]